MKFRVKVSEVSHDVEVDEVESVDMFSVKAIVESLTDISAYEQKFIYKGKVLADTLMLSSSGIAEGDTILVMKVPSTAKADTPAPASALPAGASTSVFDSAMMALLSGNDDEKAIFDAVDLLGKIVSNIIQNPSEEKYRKIKKESGALKKKLLEISGGAKCFESLGFQSIGDEYVLPAAAENWQNLLSCKGKLDGFKSKLSLKISGGAVPPASSSSLGAGTGTALAMQLFANLALRGAPAAARSSGMNVVAEFGAELSSRSGNVSTESALGGKKFIGVYFSAHWCPPCRQFTPLLAEFYEMCKEQDSSSLEIVFTSLDRDLRSYSDYCNEMPWLCLPLGSQFAEGLKLKHQFRGIPHLIVVDAATGIVVDGDARTTIMQCKGNVGRALAKWGVR